MTRRAAVEQGPIYRQRMGPNMRPPGALSPGPQRMQTVPIHSMANGCGSQNERRHVVVDSIDSIPPTPTQNCNMSYNDNGNHAPVANGYIPNNTPAPVANGYIPNSVPADPVANGYAPNVAPVPVANGYMPGVHGVAPTPVANGFIPNSNNNAPTQREVTTSTFATVNRSTSGRMLGRAQRSQTLQDLSTIPEEPQAVVRVNTYDDLEKCDVDQRFFLGERRLHVDSMESERQRLTDSLQRSNSVRTKSRVKPAPPTRKTPPRDIVNVDPVDVFPPPPPYTETDPVVDNVRNIYRVQCA